MKWQWWKYDYLTQRDGSCDIAQLIIGLWLVECAMYISSTKLT